ncbi:MAG: hypothetical protein CMO74_14540 [Verrucomicrobiales bacterium]|nr:hypothetical protein [Verrucomicrobiales bacterium]|tara:strand:+ start:43548 stop:44690 length:1143 start_codon:yes stop_codon:yes gene_type:complete
MEIKIERTPEQVELIKAMASKNRDVAYEAQAALGDFIGPLLAEVVNTAPTLSNLFSSLQFGSEDNASIPLDLYHDITDEDYVQIWSQNSPGGLPTNHVAPVQQEMKFTTYRLDSAVSFDKRFAQRSRLDVVSKTFTRIAQEILLKQEKTSAVMIMTALANAETNGLKHVFRSHSKDRFLLADLNKLFTLAKRINTSWTKGTPADRRGRGVTDLIVSPEIVEELRGLAYNPINTRGADVTAIPGTDSLREKVFNSAGIPEFYGVSIMEINEMGKKQKWNSVFDTASGDNDWDKHGDGEAGDADVAGGAEKFDGDKEEICLGIDLSKESMLRAVATDAESGSEFDLVVDDQWVSRSQKIGYYGAIEEGRMILDDKVLTGIIV